MKPLLLLAIGMSLALAQDPPLTGRSADFSNVVGRYDEPRLEASPTEVVVEEPITLRVTITGTGPAKYEPAREHLRLFPESFERDFYVQEMRDAHQVDRSRKTWTFVYQLRPKHTRVTSISDIKLVYYNPESAEKNRFETHFAESIPIAVKPRPEAVVVLPKRTMPDSFYDSAPVDLAHSATAWTWPGLLLLFGTPPALSLFGAWLWKRSHPDSNEQRQRTRQQAADVAVAKLRSPGEVKETLRQFLRDRFDLALTEPTPIEVERWLRRRGLAKDLCARARALLQTCDAQLYAPHAHAPALQADAIALVRALEADPCAR